MRDDSALSALLRRFAAFEPDEDELQYTAELLEAAADAESSEERRCGVLEALDGVAFLDDERVATVSEAVLKLLCGENEGPNEEVDEKEDDRRQRWHAVLAHYAVDERCLAVLEEDGEWHPARVRQHLLPLKGKYQPFDMDQVGGDVDADVLVVEVEFIEFGKKQTMNLADVVMDEDVAGAEDKEEELKVCLMCERPMNLTAHHVIPRVMHPKYLKKGYTREFLNTCIMICRQCHSKIHSTEDEKTLARDYNTLEKIVAHPEIARWIAYARKQKARIKPVKKSKWRVGT